MVAFELLFRPKSTCLLHLSSYLQSVTLGQHFLHCHSVVYLYFFAASSMSDFGRFMTDCYFCFLFKAACLNFSVILEFKSQLYHLHSLAVCSNPE